VEQGGAENQGDNGGGHDDVVREVRIGSIFLTRCSVGKSQKAPA